MEINGKTFLITGGSSGLGAATAKTFVDSGAKVVIADINENAGNAIVEEIGADKALFVKTDVSDEVSAQGAVDAATGFGELRGAVNCAGIGIAEKTVGKNGPHNFGSYVKIIQVNLIGTFNIIRLAASAMAKSEPVASGERGVIINTASVAAFDGQIGQIAYSASKGGIVGMTLPAARDLASLGIRVVTIAPGIFKTPLLGTLPEAVQQSLGAQVPFPSRLGRPDEYAALAKHIVENEMLNGEVIRLDGAIRMAPR
jgi:NAD(P)-dependent dehydrogenase (short-subunit alcohol dehydrogenase family)